MKKLSLLISLLLLVSISKSFAKTYTLRDAIIAASETICKKIDGKINVVAVVDIYSEYDKLSEFINSELIHEFTVTLNQTNVVERNSQALAIIEKELDYQYSGYVSDETAQSLCASLGADCLVFGSIKSDSSGWKLELRASHVESKKVIASWSGIIKKNDKDIQFQIKKSSNNDKSKQLKETQLIDSKFEKTFDDLKLKLVATMYKTELSYSDVIDVFLERLGFSNGKAPVISVFLENYSTEELSNRKGDYAWAVYESDDNNFTFLVTNVGFIAFSAYYKDGKSIGTDIEYFSFDYSKFLFQSSINLKSAGKAFTYNELSAYDRLLVGCENYINKGDSGSLIWLAVYGYEGIGMISSKSFVEMCAKASFCEDSTGENLFMCAAKDGNFEITKLLTDLGADVNKKDEKGLTALMYVSRDEKSIKILSLLIKKGANVNEEDFKGHTALWYAQQFKNNAAIKILQQAGAK